MHYGFYDELDFLKAEDQDANFNFLENVSLDIAKAVTHDSNAYNLLHGWCISFAVQLHREMGYPLAAVRYPSINEDHEPVLLHAYCVDHRFRKPLYIDARGITDNPAEFWEEFEDFVTYYSFNGELISHDMEYGEGECLVEIDDNLHSFAGGEYEHLNDDEISKFIQDYSDYYNTEKYIEKFNIKYPEEISKE